MLELNARHKKQSKIKHRNLEGKREDHVEKGEEGKELGRGSREVGRRRRAGVFAHSLLFLSNSVCVGRWDTKFVRETQVEQGASKQTSTQTFH